MTRTALVSEWQTDANDGEKPGTATVGVVLTFTDDENVTIDEVAQQITQTVRGVLHAHGYTQDTVNKFFPEGG